jgi:phage tail sheath protein FI
MTTEPIVGLSVRREAFEPAPPSNAQMSVIGLAMPAVKAAAVTTEDFAAAFPLDTPVLFGSTSATARLIDPDCKAGQAIALINAQLARLQSAAQIILVRVAEGADDDATIANIVGNAAAGTGINAFTRAGAEIGAIPRLIAAPGYTWQHDAEDAETAVTGAAKAGGNTGNGILTLADPAYGLSVKAGVYQIRCIGGARAAAAAAKAGGNTGDGTLGTLTADAAAPVGAWRVVCQAASADGGAFAVYRPDGTFDGIAIVGAAYDSAAGINFTLTDGAADFIVGDEFVVTVAVAVPADGGLFSVTDPDGVALATAQAGVAYDTAHLKFTVADGVADFIVGDGFDVTGPNTGGDARANPVAAALPAVLNAILAVAYVDAPGLTRAGDIDYRETLQSERIAVATPVVKMDDTAGDTQTLHMASAVALGLHVRRDFENEGRPFRSIMNQPVYGIVGPGRAIDFSIVDGSSEGQDLLAHQIGPLVRGESGDDFAIAEGGFVYMGFENTGAEAIWSQLHKVRGRDFIELTAIRTLRNYLGRFNLTTQTIQAVVNTVSTILSQAQARGEILGFACRFDPVENNAADLRSGKITVDARFEDVPVFRKATILSRPYSPALDATIAELLAQNDLGS